MKALTAEIIAIGTEILLGDIVNTNAAYLARGLASLGINTYHQEVVGDNPARVLETFERAFERANLVITSGGLGPTQDDLSKEMGARYFGVSLKEDVEASAHIERYMYRLGRQITENNWKQAYAPEGAIIIDNENGTAPGLIIPAEGKHVLLLPGPPNELIPMFENQMMPYLSDLEPGVISSITVKLCGVGESKVETEILDLIEKQTNPTIAPYAKTGEVHLRVTAKAENDKKAHEMMQP
ncbi:MAG: competence/damage-inducible protein A, partial [Firmicutes bacterium]|nr:competence/damage-inducible protein A [Bacillota bacterium]